MADEYHTTIAKHYVNFKDLNRILRSEISLHKDGQLRVAHVILTYKPYTKHFQSPKNIIKANDQLLALIDVVVLGFLLTKPPPEGTQDTQLPAPLAARLIYSQEPPIPSDEEERDSTPKPIHPKVKDKDFEVFYHKDAPSTSITHSSRELGFEEKTPDLLTLLTAYAGGSSPAVVVPPQLTTPAMTRTSPAKAANKKRKRGQEGKGPEETEEGEMAEPPTKEAWAGKG